MREVSPNHGISPEDFLKFAPPELCSIVTKIREQKLARRRQVPSVTLIDHSNILSSVDRAKLIDKIALMVDENLCGRSEMCIQFALLLDRSLQHLGWHSRSVAGTAIYFSQGREIFRWDHAWVRVDEEVIDANVDILEENPCIPQAVRVDPYWGPIKTIPQDRRLRENHGQGLPTDTDVEQIWWPDLKDFLDTRF